MTEDTEKFIEEFRAKLDSILDQFTVADFRRIHAKFFGALVSVEQGFKKRFPEESAKYEYEFYGDDK